MVVAVGLVDTIVNNFLQYYSECYNNEMKYLLLYAGLSKINELSYIASKKCVVSAMGKAVRLLPWHVRARSGCFFECAHAWRRYPNIDILRKCVVICIAKEEEEQD